MDGFFPGQCRAGVSVLRDDGGQVIMACSKLEEQTDDHLEIKLLAMFRGLQACVPLRIQTLRVESDSS